MAGDLHDRDVLETLTALRAEHRALDQEVAGLSAESTPDQIRIMRLKKRKLALKDRIAELEDEIHPDIIA